MNSNNTQLSFTGLVFYIGIDTHKKSWSVAIRHAGLLLKRFSMNPSPLELSIYLNKHYPEGDYKCAYEAGFGGFWIQKELTILGMHCIVVHVNDIPTTAKDKDRKTDANDASKIARELEAGSLTPIYVPDHDHLHLRSLCRSYYQAVQDCTRIKCRMKGMINFYGIEVPEHSSQWPKRFVNELYEMPLDGGTQKIAFDIYLDDFVHHRDKQLRILKEIQSAIDNLGYGELLINIRTIPGIGFRSAMTLLSEIYDIKRFKNLEHLKSYVGLVPSTHSSGTTVREYSLTMRRNKYIRRILIECAWVAIRKDPALLHVFNKLTKRMKSQQAITRIAKKLISRLRHVWISGEPYIIGVVA
jgi:transposase